MATFSHMVQYLSIFSKWQKDFWTLWFKYVQSSKLFSTDLKNIDAESITDNDRTSLDWNQKYKIYKSN